MSHSSRRGRGMGNVAHGTRIRTHATTPTTHTILPINTRRAAWQTTAGAKRDGMQGKVSAGGSPGCQSSCTRFSLVRVPPGCTLRLQHPRWVPCGFAPGPRTPSPRSLVCFHAEVSWYWQGQIHHSAAAPWHPMGSAAGLVVGGRARSSLAVCLSRPHRDRVPGGVLLVLALLLGLAHSVHGATCAAGQWGPGGVSPCSPCDAGRWVRVGATWCVFGPAPVVGALEGEEVVGVPPPPSPLPHPARSASIHPYLGTTCTCALGLCSFCVWLCVGWCSLFANALGVGSCHTGLGI
jgi:hypothetical protein